MDRHIMISYNQISGGHLARQINENLKENNYKTWIDYEQMNGNIFNAMADGIDNAFVMLVFVTDEYCKSVNCIKECEYATRKGKQVIPIKVNSQIDPSKVQGIVGLAIGGILYIDFSKPDFDDSMKQLLNQIKKYEQLAKNMTEICPSATSPETLNTSEKGGLNRIKRSLMNNKKLTLAIVIIIFALVIAIIIISITKTNTGKCSLISTGTDPQIDLTQINVKDLDPGQTEFRYSLKISDKESVFFIGPKNWNYMSNGNVIETFEELSRDNEGIVVKSNKGTFRLSSLTATINDPKPRWKKARWNNVWKKKAENQYIYPKSGSTWIEMHEDGLFAEHVLLGIDGNEDSYDFFKLNTVDYYFRLNSTGFFTKDNTTNNSTTFTFRINGSWIYKF